MTVRTLHGGTARQLVARVSLLAQQLEGLSCDQARAFLSERDDEDVRLVAGAVRHLGLAHRRSAADVLSARMRARATSLGPNVPAAKRCRGRDRVVGKVAKTALGTCGFGVAALAAALVLMHR